MSRRFAVRWPGRSRWHAPRTRRGWLITVAVAGAVVALKLTVGVAVVLLLLRHLPH
jgi:hypothetical protein